MSHLSADSESDDDFAANNKGVFMDTKYNDVSGMVLKSENKGTSVMGFIREELRSIPAGKGLAMIDLRTKVMEKFSNVPNKHQAYTRINNVMKSNFGKEYTKFVGTDGYIYISKSVQTANREVLTSWQDELKAASERIEFSI